MMLQVRIHATGGTDFYRQVAIFAYGAWLRHGYGAVCVKQETFHARKNGHVAAQVTYIPYSAEAFLPSEVTEMINAYDPKRECVFAMIDAQGSASCVTLSAEEHMGSTPKQLFDEAAGNQQHVSFAPGEVAYLKEFIADIEPGYVVFIGEDKSEMILACAEEDEEGEIIPGPEVHRLHVDFRDSLTPTGIMANLR
jgi:hypothetical protein